jgi:hypothetical protein
MIDLLQILHACAGVVVVAEATNKLERTAPLAPGLRPRDRLVDGLKSFAWLMLAMGAGGAVAAPFLIALGVPADAGSVLSRLTRPTLAETLVLCGFATLIVRTRLKEG